MPTLVIHRYRTNENLKSINLQSFLKPVFRIQEILARIRIRSKKLRIRILPNNYGSGSDLYQSVRVQCGLVLIWCYTVLTLKCPPNEENNTGTIFFEKYDYFSNPKPDQCKKFSVLDPGGQKIYGTGGPGALLLTLSNRYENPNPWFCYPFYSLKFRPQDPGG
jgi:hypothetical protein